MRQEINLYQPIFRKQRKVFSSRALLQATALVVAGLLLVYGYGVWRLQGLEEELLALQGQRQAASQRLEKLAKQFPQREKSRVLEAELQRLIRDVRLRRKVQELLTSGAYGNRKGFSERLAALARQHIAGLWLTKVEISEVSKGVGLAGSAVDPKLVPKYVQRFSYEPSLAGMRFQHLRVDRPEPESARVQFQLRTSGEAP